MDRLFGPAHAAASTTNGRVAFVSASKESDTHPRPAVVNAFIRRGFGVYQTKGQNVWHHRNMPAREGWKSLERLQFFAKVQSWD